MKRIPIGDFPIGPDERTALQRVIDSGRISEHREVKSFEYEYAEWLGTKHCIALSSGTAALMVGLAASRHTAHAGRTNVLVPALTFIATVNAIKLTGYEPIFSDIDVSTYTLRPNGIMWHDADIILPVHLFGYAADMDKILTRQKWSITQPLVVEDAAEAHGTTHCRQKVGTFGLWSAFSFYIAHSIQAGELGCLCTDDDTIASIARSLKAHGRICQCRKCTRNEGYCPHLEHGDPRFTFQYIGYNFKPMEFQAALARVQLQKSEENFNKRRCNFRLLKTYLAPIEHHINPIYEQPGMVPMAFPIVLQTEGIRDRVIYELESKGIEARPLFGCIPTQQPAYSAYKDQYEGKLPVAEYYGANGFYVGCHQYLSKGDMSRAGRVIVDTVKGLS